MALVINKSKSKKEASVSDKFALLNWSSAAYTWLIYICIYLDPHLN